MVHPFPYIYINVIINIIEICLSFLSMSVGALVHSTPKLNYITHPLCANVLHCGNSMLCCYRPYLFPNSWSGGYILLPRDRKY